MIKFVFGGAGSGKTRYVTDDILRVLRETDKRVFLLVPEQQTVIYETRLARDFPPEYATRLEATSFTRLGNTVARTVGGLARPTLSGGVRALLTWRAASSVWDSLAYLSSNAVSGAKNSLVPALAGAINELRINGITLSDLEGAVAEAENEVKSLRIVVEKEKESMKSLEKEEQKLKRRLNVLFHRSLPDAYVTQDMLQQYDGEKRAEASGQLSKALTPGFLFGQEEEKPLTALCFSVVRPESQSENKPYVLLRHAGEDYPVEMGASAKGNARRVMNFISSFDKVIDRINMAITEVNDRLDQIEYIMKNPDETNVIKLREREEELKELRELVKSDSFAD